MTAISPFKIEVSEQQLDDLHQRLDRVRWPDAEPVSDWSQGIPLAYMKEIVDYWRTQYDWRKIESRLNGYPQFTTELDGVNIHFLHVRSPEPNAMPLILTHGWPGSILEFMKVIEPLTDPVAHGGDAADAFHLVCPALPGYGFSGNPRVTGWGVDKIAREWANLMARLGYDRYVAQGGDWGSMVTTHIALADPEHCAAMHTNMPIATPDPATMEDLTPQEQSALAGAKFYRDWDSGYSKQQSTRPQTLGYGLVDSPTAQAAWIIEKFYQWMDCDGHPENILSRDELLDNVMTYWLNGSGASSARLYWESFGRAGELGEVTIPAGISIFPKEIFRCSRRWAEGRYKQIVHWNELEKGGHFAAAEQPELFLNEVRTCFRTVR